MGNHLLYFQQIIEIRENLDLDVRTYKANNVKSRQGNILKAEINLCYTQPKNDLYNLLQMDKTTLMEIPFVL